MKDTGKRHYSKNVGALKTLLAERIKRNVIHRSKQKIVEELLAERSIPPRKVQTSEYSGRYLIYWIE